MTIVTAAALSAWLMVGPNGGPKVHLLVYDGILDGYIEEHVRGCMYGGCTVGLMDGT